MEVPLDLTSKRGFVWPDGDAQSGENTVINSLKVRTDLKMNNVIAERFDGLSEGRVYTDLDEQRSERTDDEDDGEVMDVEKSSVFIKEEVDAEELEDKLVRESVNDVEGYRENVRSDVCAEGDEENESQEVGADGMMGESSVDECKKEDEKDENGIEGYILPDMKPSINSTGIEKAAVMFSMPLLADGEETKVDGGTAAFLCETMMHIAPDKRSMKIAKHYAAIRATESAEAIEALKKALHREKNFACNICGNLFKDRRNLNRHIKRIHCDDKKFHCETCGKGFCFVSHLMRHAESHSVEKKHVCETCGRGFNLMSNLERHMITHSQEKPFECCVCGARFSQNYYLQAHAVIHTGEKRFECATCGMKFGNRSNLRRHFRSHSSEKPYSCPICNQRFRFSNNISKHKKKYHKAT